MSGPVPAPKSVWNKPLVVSAAAPVVDASDVSKKTNNVAPLAAPVKSPWGAPVTSAVPTTVEEKSAVFPVKLAASTVVAEAEPAKNSSAPSVTVPAAVTTIAGGWAAIAAKGAAEKTTDVPPIKMASADAPAETTKAPESAPVAEKLASDAGKSAPPVDDKPAAVVDKPASPTPVDEKAAKAIIKAVEVTPVKKTTGPQSPAKWAEAPEFKPLALKPTSSLPTTSSLPPPDVWVQAPVFTPKPIKSTPILPAAAAWVSPVTAAQPDVTQTVLAREISAVPSSSVTPLAKQPELPAVSVTTLKATDSSENAAVTPAAVESSVTTVETGEKTATPAEKVVETIPAVEAITTPTSNGPQIPNVSETKSDVVAPSGVASLPNGESSPDETDSTPTKEDAMESDKTGLENDSSTSSSKSGSQIKLKFNYKDGESILLISIIV